MRRVRMLVMSALLASACTATPSTDGEDSPDAATQAEVLSVTDGDSLVVQTSTGRERVRLIGVNAPESGECYGVEAADALRSLLERRVVEIVTDAEPRDRYARLLGYVYSNGQLVNEELARQGFALAHPYPPNTALQDELEAAEENARANQRGMWAPTACVSAIAAGLSLQEVRADPPGRDEADLNGEWVIIANDGPDLLDLAGWVLRDASSIHRFALPTGTTLEPGATLVVMSGCGRDRAGELHWCADGPVWDNHADTALVLDPEGMIAAVFKY